MPINVKYGEGERPVGSVELTFCDHDHAIRFDKERYGLMVNWRRPGQPYSASGMFFVSEEESRKLVTELTALVHS